MEVAGYPVDILRIGDHLGDGAAKLFPCLLCGVGLEDPGVALHHLDQRPEGDSLPVRERAALAPIDQLGIGVDHTAELGYEPRLPDAGNPHERDELRCALATRAGQSVSQEAELFAASDELRRPALLDVDAEAPAGRRRLPDRDRLGLAFGLDGLYLAVLDRPLGCAVRGLVDEDAVRRRGRLEAR